MGPLNGVEGGEDGIEVDQNKRGVKRPGADHESDDESSAAPPENDIYRSRQQKRVHWKKGGGFHHPQNLGSITVVACISAMCYSEPGLRGRGCLQQRLTHLRHLFF